MPLPGTSEFKERKNGHWNREKTESRREVETFGEANKFEYNNLPKTQQDMLRLYFYLDSSQTAELDAVCNKYNRMYQGKPMDFARTHFLEDEKDREEVLRALGNSMKLERKLYPNHVNLELQEKKIQDIEADAAAKIDGDKGVQRDFEVNARRSLGAKVRLALLGDAEATAFYNFNPKAPESDKTALRTADDLLKVYEADLEAKVEEIKSGAKLESDTK